MSTPATRALPADRRRLDLLARAGLAAAVLASEKFLLNFFVDFHAAQAAHGFGAVVRMAQHWGFRFAVTCGLCLALLAYTQGDEDARKANAAASVAPVRARWAVVHAALVLPLVPLSYSLYRNDYIAWPLAVVVSLWLLFALAATFALLIALAPWPHWRRGAASLGVLWLYAALAGAGAACAMEGSQLLWHPTAGITFDLVERLLRPLIPSLHVYPATRILSTGRFSVQIADNCSGLEGVGLMLAFCGAWLLYFRREYVFPRALILLPIGLIAVFALNVLRIAALVLIGHFHSADTAIYGFHSQAGWIGFNCAAAGLAVVSRRSAWLNRAAAGCARGDAAGAAQSYENPTAVYLLPLLALLAAGMIARASSGSFETMYFLRLPVTALTLAYIWPRLAQLDWRFSWRGIACGLAVFGMWVLAAHLLVPASPMPAALRAMTPWGRDLWLAARVFTGVLIVPVAEELAYRGYLLRRLVSADFASVRYTAVGLWPLVGTAVAFGLVHGGLWLPGIGAGLAYGLLVIRTDRLGEAVAAHSTTNALIVVGVLFYQQWELW